jgi:HEAT repeat protein/thiol-disulfide isomerase/thioredoxin
MTSHRLVVVVGLAVAVGFAHSAAAEAPDKRVWQNDLEAACRTARNGKGNVLVRVGAEWCGWCEKLNDEIEQAEVQKELGNFTLVYLDADKDTEPVRRLGIGPIPALRVLTPDGKVIAMHDGYLPAAELIDWLNQASGGEGDQTPEILTSTEPLDDKGVSRLFNELGRREARRREAAIRRLQSQSEAASNVVDLLRSKKLAVRLSAVELLRGWRAPIEGIDPWRAETLDETRLAALGEWAEKAAAPAEDEPLTAEELSAAQREIDKLLAGDEVEAEAIAARLARYGRRLLDEVYARLKQAAGDRERERLTWLRYRLVATDALALGWPGGLARLAANDPAVRHQAAQELAARATAADEPLLLETFGDPDPLVRELSLKALSTAGGERVSKSLLRLLDDPEPNVRAAVLKQLAQSPSPSMVSPVSKYIEAEADADLVVHAVRLLRVTGGKAAVDSLMKLLTHASWRVRAEAAEALGECVSSHQRQVAESLKADVYVALIDSLDDEDGFVVSRAMLGLRHADVPAMIEPLATAAEKRPELAKTAAEAMIGGQHTRATAIRRLWDWTAHANEDLRAAGLVGLSGATADGLGEAFEKALTDASVKVRLAAAEQLFKTWEHTRPYSEEIIVTAGAAQVDDDPFAEPPAEPPAEVEGSPAVEGPPAKGDEAASEEEQPKAKPPKRGRNRPDPWEPWLAEFRNGEGRPRWTAPLAAPLQKMLADGEPAERLAAALALVPLGHESEALPVLRDLVAADRQRLAAAARVLPWLPWDKRLAWYQELRKQAQEAEAEIQLAHQFTLLRDLRADEPLWQVVGGEQVTAAVAQELLDDLKRVYRIGQPHYGNGSPPAPQLDEEKARHFALEGTSWQRLVAMSLLLATDTETAAELAQQVYDDAAQNEETRQDALQFFLLAQKAGQSRKTALDALRKGSAGARRTALAYLARGNDPLKSFRDGAFHVESDDNVAMFGEVESEQSVAPEVPEGLAADDVRPFLTDADPALAAFAGYLLTQLGEAEGLEPLLKQWRTQGAESNVWTPLVYHAVAALDDSRHVKLLVEIYEGIDHNAVDVRDFYWAIRSMSGPEILQLRKRIRDEVGMDQLRR